MQSKRLIIDSISALIKPLTNLVGKSLNFRHRPNIGQNRPISDVAKAQLMDIFSITNINPKSYSWADIMGGQDGLWSIELAKIIENRVQRIDFEPINLAKYSELNNKGVDFINADIGTYKLTSVNAAFLRTNIQVSFLEKIVTNNEDVDLIIHIPIWDRSRTAEKVSMLSEYFDHCSVLDLGHLGCEYVRGPNSTSVGKIEEEKDIVFAQTIVIICFGRK